jgi:hypothetical protein
MDPACPAEMLLVLPTSGIKEDVETHITVNFLKGSDDVVSHSELLCFFTLFIVRYARN